MAIILANGYLLEGDAAVASKVNYYVSGLDGTTLAYLASGQLPSAKGTLYTAAGTDVIASIILFNTDTSARAVNLYLNDGTASRQILGIDALGAGYHALFDGNKLTVYDNNGAIQYTMITSVSDITLNNCVGKGTWTASGTWTLPAMTFGGDIQLGEVSILLDATLSAEGKWSGIVEAGTAGATLAFGDLVYYAVADSRWELADADAAATAFGKLGICILAAANDGDATKVLLWGKVFAGIAFPTLTIGAPVFVSTTAGDVQVAAPTGTTDIVRIVGYGNTADELFFCPENDYLELV